MKRILLITVIVVIVLAGGVLGFALVNANRLIASFKPELERIASSVLGGRVTLGSIDASILPSTHLTVRDVKVEGAPTELLGLKEIVLDLRLLDLLQKKLAISSLTVVKPEILVIKDAAGIRLAGLPRSKPASSEASAPQPPAESGHLASTDRPATAPSSPLDIALEEIRVDNGVLRYKDEANNSTETLEQLNVRAAVALSGAEISVPSFSCSAMARKSIDLEARGSGISLRGKSLVAREVVATLLGNSITFSADLDLSTMSGVVDLKAPDILLANFAPVLEMAPPAVRAMKSGGGIGVLAHAKLGGDAYRSEGSVSLDSVQAKIAGLDVTELQGAIAANATSGNATFSAKDLALKLNGQPLSAQFEAAFKAPVIELSDLQLKMFGGTAAIKGTLGLKDNKPLSASFRLLNLDGSQALAALGQKPDGQKFTAHIDDVEGRADVPMGGNLPNDMSATIKLSLSKAELKGFNLAGAVLRAVKNLPFLSGPLYDSVPAEQRAEVDGPNTMISKLTASATLNAGKLTTPDLRAQSAIFDLEAEGTVGFDSSVNLNATLLFNPKFSESMVKKAKDLKGLLDDKGRLIIPLTITGTAPKLMVLPNIERLLTTGAGRKLQEKAADFLGKAFGGGKGSSNKGLFGF